jgi:phage-related protein
MPLNTFNIDAEAKATSSIAYPTIENQFGDGYSQAADDGLNRAIEEWDLSYSFRDATQAAALDLFIATQRGSVSFLWTPPGESVAKMWRIKMPVAKSVMRGCDAIPLYFGRTLRFKRVYA